MAEFCHYVLQLSDYCQTEVTKKEKLYPVVIVNGVVVSELHTTLEFDA